LEPGIVAMRLVETSGGNADVAVDSVLGAVSGLRQADLLETPQHAELSIRLHGYQIATVLARLELPNLLEADLKADHAVLGPEAEAAQPLYGRYWLHNRGPAPLGGLSAVAHLHPHHVTAAAGSDVVLRLTAASDCSDAALCGTITVVDPPGWTTTPAQLPFTLKAGQYREADLVVRVPPGTPSGLYPVRAQLRITGDDAPPAWQQVVEDVCTVSVGEVAGEELVYLIDGPHDLEVAAGDSARLIVTVGSDACADLALEAHLISPWGTWEWIGPATCGAVMPACGTAELAFDVTPPAWQDPGQWWALVRIGCAGRLVYSPAVKVTVR
ncbi:MAG: alpha-mannosidase, partial [Mycobacterium sp.]|nr:alpha-mannosidase [Mycobacterium sp.]